MIDHGVTLIIIFFFCFILITPSWVKVHELRNKKNNNVPSEQIPSTATLTLPSFCILVLSTILIIVNPASPALLPITYLFSLPVFYFFRTSRPLLFYSCFTLSFT
ncbi:hypothetical protein F4775DRAFT_552112 [Biscogniauxia sp. FL1348]|nr:hypothetical protein F4775DRAFT_552112 [Biscogniauxia sp. FL1348]